MPQIEITDLNRCSGGHHYHATVTIDGGKPQEIAFTSSEIAESAKAVKLKDVVLFLCGKELAALGTDRKPTIAEEKQAVIGKRTETEIVDVKADAAIDVRVRG